MRRANPAVLAMTALVTHGTLGDGLVVNEYCAVGSTKWLNGGTATVDATGGAAEDLTFGRVLGNGNNWIELVVTTDHLDIRGWQLRWAESLKFTSTGQNIWYGDGLVNQGVITFSNDARWSDLRAGTILTVIEFDKAGGGWDDDFTFDPCAGDWWISVHAKNNPVLVTTVTNVTGDSAGNFSVGNDGWLLEVVNAAGQVMTPQCGEGAPGWAGGGVSSTENCRLEGDPRLVTDTTMYDDADSSSFGRPNSWGDPVNLGCTLTQDFGDLRAPVSAECATCNPVFLNEYNAVASTVYLNGGTATTDANGGASADAFFGRTLGNGGNWFELVVAVDHFDMRGMKLEWKENKTGGNSGTITLRSDVPALADLAGGTIVTFIEKNTAGGGKSTDLAVDIAAGDRWMNLCTTDASVVASTTSTRAGATFGSFTTSSDRWTLTIKDASGAVIAATAGEGSLGYHRGGVSNTDVCRLEENPSGRVDASSWFDDTGRFSTFGAPNTWANCPDDSVVHVQDFSSLPACAVACFGDLDGSAEVDQGDIAFALLDYGPCAGCASDLDGSSEVDFGDVALVLLSAGPCQ